MDNSRVKYKKILDAALLVLSFLIFCAMAFLGDGSGMALLIVLVHILMYLFFLYGKFNDWVNKGDNNEDNL